MTTQNFSVITPDNFSLVITSLWKKNLSWSGCGGVDVVSYHRVVMLVMTPAGLSQTGGRKGDNCRPNESCACTTPAFKAVSFLLAFFLALLKSALLSQSPTRIRSARRVSTVICVLFWKICWEIHCDIFNISDQRSLQRPSRGKNDQSHQPKLSNRFVLAKPKQKEVRIQPKLNRGIGQMRQ